MISTPSLVTFDKFDCNVLYHITTNMCIFLDDELVVSESDIPNKTLKNISEKVWMEFPLQQSFSHRKIVKMLLRNQKIAVMGFSAIFQKYCQTSYGSKDCCNGFFSNFVKDCWKTHYSNFVRLAYFVDNWTLVCVFKVLLGMLLLSKGLCCNRIYRPRPLY